MGAPQVLMMAAGTGGHVFPALAVAKRLEQQGAQIHWLGTPAGIENELVAPTGYVMHQINMQGLRGKGVKRMLALPRTLLAAVLAAVKVIRSNRIDVVVGFGGYVSAPGGIAARMTGTPLIVHEQNAIAGMSNRYLAKFASRVLQAFAGTFAGNVNPTSKLQTVGNPVRQSICELPAPSARYEQRGKAPLRLLVVGGSLGAQILNRTMPPAYAALDKPIHVWHQCGRQHLSLTQQTYRDVGVTRFVHDLAQQHPVSSATQAVSTGLTAVDSAVEVSEFIEDMAAAYAWADVILCRAGALTVTEIQTIGLAAIFVPLPHAVDDHQTANARHLADAKAAILLPQSQLDAAQLARHLEQLTRQTCLTMAEQGYQLAYPQSTQLVADWVWHYARPTASQ